VTNPQFPSISLLVPGNAQAGDYIGGWHGMFIREKEGWSSTDGPFSFSICTDSSQVHGGGTSSRLIPVGARGDQVYPEPVLTTADGYSVYTTLGLNPANLGFVVRWKATNRWGDEGDWVSPSGTWGNDANTGVFGQSRGLPFWRWTVTRHTNAYGVQGRWRNQPTNLFNSLADWNLFVEGYPNPPNDGLLGGYFGIHYDAWVEVRYVVIGPPKEKYIPSEYSTTVNVVKMLPVPPRTGGVTMQQNVFIRRLPHGTCQTPFHKDVLVALTADPQDLYTNTVSTTPTHFDLTLLDCPDVDVGFSFRAPPEIDILNEAQGVIGLDSTATAQGVGVQLRHRDGWFGDAPIQFNQPGDPDRESPVYWRSRNDGILSDQGRNHTIPLTAAVYHTGGPIIPGTIRASLIVFIQHR